jgi:hypothetical protein
MCYQGDLDAGDKDLRFALSVDPADRTTVEGR